MGNTPPAACGGDAAPAPDTAALDRADVTLSPFQGNKGVTAMGGERPKQDKAISQLLPQLPLLPAEHSTVENFARASSLLDETFGRIAGWWVEGAELPPDTLEGDVDDAVLAGDLEALRTALTVYEQAARERCSAKVVRESGGKWHR
jgi:hypothetical protein